MGLRIARVCPGFLPLEDGYGYYITFTMLSKAQAALGNDVTVFYPNGGRPFEEWGYTVNPLRRSIPGFLFFNARLADKIQGFDIIHSHARAALPILSAKKRPPAIVHLHGLPYRATERTSPTDLQDLRAYASYRLFLRKADHVITYCESLKRRVQSLFGLPADRVTYVPNGVDPALFKGNGDLKDQLGVEDSRVVLYVGRFSEIKGIFEFLESIPLIKQRVPNAKFLFVGCNSQLEKTLQGMGIREDCILVPHVPYNKVADYYRSADVHVALSKVYGYQKTVLESLASGTPVVVSDYPDGRDVVGHAGVPVDPSKPSDIARGVETVLQDRKIARWARSRSRLIRSSYTWKRSAESIQAVYDELLSR